MLTLYCWKKGKEREINGRKKKIFKVGKKKKKEKVLASFSKAEGVQEMMVITLQPWRVFQQAPPLRPTN